MTDALARHAAERILDAERLLTEKAKRNAKACKLNDTTDVERDDTLTLFVEMRELFAGARRRRLPSPPTAAEQGLPEDQEDHPATLTDDERSFIHAETDRLLKAEQIDWETATLIDCAADLAASGRRGAVMRTKP